MERTGTFSSSEIHKLMKGGRSGGFGAPALTYIAEKRMELRLLRPLNNETDAKPANWGKFLEKRCFDLLGLEYKLRSQDRLVHPDIPAWTGAPDCILEDTVCDIKCPFTLKSFCESVDAMNNKNVPYHSDIDPSPVVEWNFKELRPEYYWQLISNAILTGKKYVEIIVYVPYKEELAEIREMAQNLDSSQTSISFINWASDEQLPYLNKEGQYKNINILRWIADEEDKKLLTKKVQEAIKLLIA